jgi:hypothetical protein
MRAGLLLLFFAVGCERGPTVYLGRAPVRDASVDAGSPDAGDAEVGDADADHDHDDDDDDPIPCEEEDDCDDGTPFCHETRGFCVECLRDDDCDRDEHCTRGSCRD